MTSRDRSSFKAAHSSKKNGWSSEVCQRLGWSEIHPMVLTVALVGIVCALGYWIWTVRPQPNDSKSASQVEVVQQTPSAGGGSTSGSGEGAAVQGQGDVVVHVVGSVSRPGVYTLKGKPRVIDAVKKAGGFKKSAARAGINLAAIITDGQQVYIPSKAELKKKKSKDEPASTNPMPSGSNSPTPVPDGAAGLINVNTADMTALESLPGIGPATAQKIIADREQNGPYKNINDLDRVSGIGLKKVEAMQGVAEAK